MASGRIRFSWYLGITLGLGFSVLLAHRAWSGQKVRYNNRLRAVRNPRSILADYPGFVAPVGDMQRWEAEPLVTDASASLSVRAWRFSYNARGIIEIPNRLDGGATAVVVVHPWGIDDGQGWKSPEPAGVAFNCTPEKNRQYRRHVAEVLNPFLKRLRSRVRLVAYSLPGVGDTIRRGLYRTVDRSPSTVEREAAAKLLQARLQNYRYRGGEVSTTLDLDPDLPVPDYFRKFPGLDAGEHYNGIGFWDLPIPVVKEIDVAPDDLVIFDGEGYPKLKSFLKSQGVRNILLAGYATDMCVKATCAGYQNLERDFNLFLVGDATQATFPANLHSRYATNAALSYAALERLVTQVQWIQPLNRP